jgi:hypothetical protein
VSVAHVRLTWLPRPRDTFAPFDPILAAADISESPWHEGQYTPDYDLFRRLLEIPIADGYATTQASGRMAKALDAWIAHELRRAGFPADAVCPRARQPRMLPADVAPLERQIEKLEELVENEGKKAGEAALPRTIRSAINHLRDFLPGQADANVLGRFYVKQVDVLVSAWQRGPDVLVSTKTQFSSYLKNKNNRYEEAVGEASNLRDRYPMAAMGFAYLVRSNVFEEGGAFALLRDLLVRLRRPDGPFDSTMLLVADWDDGTKTLVSVEDPAEQLAAPKFFEDLLDAVMTNTPVDVHPEIRLRRLGEPTGGMPPPEESVAPEE